MLKKMFGYTLISKFWVILLMEAGFNFSIKTVYGGRMLDNTHFHGLTMEEIFNEKNEW